MRSWIFPFFLFASSASFAMTKCNQECPFAKPPASTTESPSPSSPAPAPHVCKGECCYDTRWTGFTAGVYAGGMINTSEGNIQPIGAYKLPSNVNDNPQRADSFDFHGGAFITGAQVGYNYQMKVVVLGAETDFTYSTLDCDHKKTRTLTGDLSGTFSDKLQMRLNWFGTLRARFGYAVKAVPLLIYGTGGFAYGDVRTNTKVDLSASNTHFRKSDADWKIGWTAGGGVEWGVTRHWSLKTEYLYMQLRAHHYHVPSVPASTFLYNSEVKTHEHIIRLGVNYTL